MITASLFLVDFSEHLVFVCYNNGHPANQKTELRKKEGDCKVTHASIQFVHMS